MLTLAAVTLTLPACGAACGEPDGVGAHGGGTGGNTTAAAGADDSASGDRAHGVGSVAPAFSGGPREDDGSDFATAADPARFDSSWPDFARGVAWDANWRDRSGWYGTPAAAAALDDVAEMGGDWIAVTPFGSQRSVDEATITFRRGWRDLDDDVRAAHERGLRVLVKPHIWSHEFWDGSGNWRGTIEMSSDADWARWFADYTAWIVAEASTAQEVEADAFCIGLEYLKSSRAHAERWRAVIAAVREVYSGPLIYAAHVDELDLPFWDELDAIGVNAYYPLSRSRAPEVAPMVEEWGRVCGRLATLSERWRKPVVFTEVGYASVDGAAMAPYRWPNGGDRQDDAEQACCYRALFEAVAGRPWFAGLFLWKYKITVETLADDPAEYHFTFQDKPAEADIRAGFARRFAYER